MAVIHSLRAEDTLNVRNEPVKRNWASREPGVVLVFCIVFLVGCGILALIVQKMRNERKAERAKWEVTEVKA